jgi:tRNA(fMet)-specific endonuclease VapC
MYLLDTNIVSNILRNPFGVAAAKLQQIPDGEVVVSIIVACELRFGVRKRNAAALEMLVEGFLSRTPVLPFTAPADHAYAMLRLELEAAGTPISANDLFIAAHALALDATLVTDNEREFARIQGLKVENWLH